MKEKLKTGNKIFFDGEPLPMEVIAISDRYAVCVRSLDIESDFELLAFEVERGAYYDSQSAYEDLKDAPIYSLLDFEQKKKAPSNLIFNLYDFWSKESCEDCLKDLGNGTHDLSKRHGVDLNIDWDRTLTKAQP